jgi:hypothetical protein
VNGLSKRDGPSNRDGLDEPEPIEVLASLVVYLWNKSPWPTCLPRKHFIVEDSEVLVRSLDLALYPHEGTRVNLQDVILPRDAALPCLEMVDRGKHESEPTQTIPAKDGDIEVPIPSRDDFLETVKKVAGPRLRKQLDEKDPPPERSESD